MGYFELGFITGLFIYFFFLLLVTFSKKFREYFYCNLLEDTYLGDAGEYLYFPDKYDLEENNAGKNILLVLILIGLHLLLFLATLIVFSILGGVLFPFIVLGVVIGPIVYFFVRRKRAKQLAKIKAEEAAREAAALADDEQK